MTLRSDRRAKEPDQASDAKPTAAAAASSRPMRYVTLCLVVFLAALAVFFYHYLTTSQDQQGPEATEAPATIYYSWWGNDPRHQYTLKGLQDFREKNPDIRVRARYGVWNSFEKRYDAFMNARDESDVMQINYAWISHYSPDGTRYYDLRKLSDVIDLSQFSEEDLAFGESNGALNALPIAYNMPVFYYNQDLLDRYGLQAPRTWDDLFAMAKVMSADGIYPLSANDKQTLMLLLAWYEQTTGTAVFDASGRCQVGQEGFEQILAMYQRLVDEKVINPNDKAQVKEFANGQVAGVLIWVSDASRYCSQAEKAGIHVALGQNLSLDGVSFAGWYMKPATMLAVSSLTSSPKAAGRLVNYLLNDPDYALMQGTEKGVPVSRSAYAALEANGKLEGYEKDATDQMHDHQGDLKAMVPIMEDSDVLSAFSDASKLYLFGKADLATCAGQVMSAIEEEQ